LFVFLESRPDIIMMLERYGMYILLGVLIFAPGLISQLIFVPALTITSIVTGVSLGELINLL
jgi:hypothetical protein